MTEQPEPDANGWYRPEVVPPSEGWYQVYLSIEDGRSRVDDRVCYLRGGKMFWVDEEFGETVLAWRIPRETPKPEWIK